MLVYVFFLLSLNGSLCFFVSIAVGGALYALAQKKNEFMFFVVVWIVWYTNVCEHKWMFYLMIFA